MCLQGGEQGHRKDGALGGFCCYRFSFSKIKKGGKDWQREVATFASLMVTQRVVPVAAEPPLSAKGLCKVENRDIEKMVL